MSAGQWQLKSFVNLYGNLKSLSTLAYVQRDLENRRQSEFTWAELYSESRGEENCCLDNTGIEGRVSVRIEGWRVRVFERIEADLGWLIDAQRFRAINALVYQDIRSTHAYTVLLARECKYEKVHYQCILNRSLAKDITLELSIKSKRHTSFRFYQNFKLL